MIKRLAYLCLVCSSLFLASCKKDDPTPQGTDDFGGTYLPLKTGNKWSYEGDIKYDVEVTDNTKAFDGVLYKELKQTFASGVASSYYRVIDGAYNIYGTVPAHPSLGYLKQIILKDNVKKADTWTVELTTSIYSKAKYVYEVLGQVGPRTVKGTSYEDVLAVKLYTYGVVIIPGSDPEETLSATQTTYYAKNVGVIEQTSSQQGLNVQLVSKSLK